jgi:ribose-phosphate pyrophosphokinase
MIYLNDQPVNTTIFPDNTSQVWKLPKDIFFKSYISIKWAFSNEGEFLQLAQLKHLLSNKCQYGPFITLTLTYLPYGRQDKEVCNEATFALRTFAALLNTLQFDSVIIHDPHSKIALDLINNSHAVYPERKILDARVATNSPLLCYPDKGAVSKYSETYPGWDYIYGQKVRDQLTGNITHYELIGDCVGQNVLIVDDICDGGMTFILLAKSLLAAGAKEVNLFVTHGIFSKGTRVLFEAGIKRVFTQDGEVGPRETSIQF